MNFTYSEPESYYIFTLHGQPSYGIQWCVHLCMHICMYVCTYVYMYAWHAWVCTCISKCVGSLYVCIFLYVCLCVYMCFCAHVCRGVIMCTCAPTCVYICICMHMCMWSLECMCYNMGYKLAPHLGDSRCLLDFQGYLLTLSTIQWFSAILPEMRKLS